MVKVAINGFGCREKRGIVENNKNLKKKQLNASFCFF